MMLEYATQLKATLQGSLLSHVPFLAEFLSSAIDLLIGPLTGVRTSHYWVFVLQSLVVAAAVFAWRHRGDRNYGMERFFGYCFPKQLFFNPSTYTDIKLKFANNFLMPFVNVGWRFTTAFFTTIFFGFLVSTFGPPLKIFEWNAVTMVAFTVLFALFEDLGFYLCHLAHHKIPALWAFHKVHHSAEVLTPLTATRNHPVEFILIPPCRSFTASLFMAPTLYIFTTAPTLVELFGMNLVIAISGALGNQLLHSHIWISWSPFFERIIVSPAQHQIHHSSAPQHHDKNMAGMFSLWDWIFGTLYIARSYEPLTFGVYGASRQPHDGLLAAYVRPFWDALPDRSALARWIPGGIRQGLSRVTRLARQTTVGDKSAAASASSLSQP